MGIVGRMPTPPVDAEALERIGLFAGLPQPLLEALAAELPTFEVAAGQTVIHEGEPAREMYVVLQGELEVFKRAKTGTEVRVAVLGPGDWFGEMAILDVQPRSATVRAVAPTRLLALSSEHVDRLLYRRDPKAYALLVTNLARELSRRLRVADDIMAHLLSTVSEAYVRRSHPPP